LFGHVALCECALDLTEHRVERETETTDLGSFVGGGDTPAETAGGDRPSRRAHALEWAHAAAYEQPRDHENDDRDAAADGDLEEEQGAQRAVHAVERDGGHGRGAIAGRRHIDAVGVVRARAVDRQLLTGVSREVYGKRWLG